VKGIVWHTSFDNPVYQRILSTTIGYHSDGVEAIFVDIQVRCDDAAPPKNA
jgi:hypothetical protein